MEPCFFSPVFDNCLELILMNTWLCNCCCSQMTFLIACVSEQLLGSAIKLGSSTPTSAYTKDYENYGSEGICIFIASMTSAIIVSFSKRVELFFSVNIVSAVSV